MGELIIDTRCGLGNRLCAIFSAWVIAESEKIPLRIIWRRSIHDGAYCHFTDLFSTVKFDNIEIDDIEQDAHTEWPNVHRLSDMTLDRVRAGESVQIGVRELLPHEKIPDWLFLDRLRECFLRLQLNPDVQKRIDTPQQPFVGLHVRFTDHIPATLSTPQWLYRNAIDHILSEYPSLKIWACGDAPEFLRELYRRHPDNITLSPSAMEQEPPDRYSAVGIQTALADLVSLSRAQLVIASPNSSFSTLAGYFGTRNTYSLSVHPSFDHHYTRSILWIIAHYGDTNCKPTVTQKMLGPLIRLVSRSAFQNFPLFPTNHERMAELSRKIEALKIPKTKPVVI